MNKVNSRIKTLEQFRIDRDKGIIQGIPLWEDFPKLGDVVPTIEKSRVILNFANSGVGKSMITRYKDIFVPWNYCRNHPELEIDLKFVIFLLEDSEEEFIDYMLSLILYKVHKIRLHPKSLRSANRQPIGKDIIQKLNSIEPIVDELISKCTIYDSIYNSYGIYKEARGISEERGDHTYIHEPTGEVLNKVQFSQLKELSDRDSNKDRKELIEAGYNLRDYQNFWNYNKYIPKNSKEHVILVCDNINCLNPDRYQPSLMAAMEDLMYNWFRKSITKHWGWTTVAVQQSSASSEEEEYTFKGESIIRKLEPKLSDLGDSKKTQRACHLIYALMAPARHGISNYLNYNVKELEDRLRVLFLLKANEGISNIRLPLWFYGECNAFNEMPKTINSNYIAEKNKITL